MKKTATSKAKSAKKTPKKPTNVIVEEILASQDADQEPQVEEVPQKASTQETTEIPQGEEKVVEEPRKEIIEEDSSMPNKEEDVTEESIPEEVRVEEKPSFYERVVGEKPKTSIDVDTALGANTEKSQDELPPIEKSNKKLFLLGFIVFIVTVLVTGAFGFFILNSQNQPEEVLEEKEKVVETPTPTPLPSLDKTDWTIEILNGSGVSGEAAKVADALEELGFENVEVGNADENIDETEVYVSEDKSDEDVSLFLKEIEPELGELEVTDTLDEDEELDARIILGSQ